MSDDPTLPVPKAPKLTAGGGTSGVPDGSFDPTEVFDVAAGVSGADAGFLNDPPPPPLWKQPLPYLIAVAVGVVVAVVFVVAGSGGGTDEGPGPDSTVPGSVEVADDPIDTTAPDIETSTSVPVVSSPVTTVAPGTGSGVTVPATPDPTIPDIGDVLDAAWLQWATVNTDTLNNYLASLTALVADTNSNPTAPLNDLGTYPSAQELADTLTGILPEPVDGVDEPAEFGVVRDFNTLIEASFLIADNGGDGRTPFLTTVTDADDFRQLIDDTTNALTGA